MLLKPLSHLLASVRRHNCPNLPTKQAIFGRSAQTGVVGRTKELIVHFGHNVYPAEVEAVLNAHPGVVRSAVIGRSVEGVEGDEEVVAFVQLLPGSPCTATALAEYAAQHLAPYKRPSQILIIPASDSDWKNHEGRSCEAGSSKDGRIHRSRRITTTGRLVYSGTSISVGPWL